MSETDIITTKEAAAIMAVTPQTIRRWTVKGILNHAWKTADGKGRYYRYDVAKLRRQMGMTKDDASLPVRVKKALDVMCSPMDVTTAGFLRFMESGIVELSKEISNDGEKLHVEVEGDRLIPTQQFFDLLWNRLNRAAFLFEVAASLNQAQFKWFCREFQPLFGLVSEEVRKEVWLIAGSTQGLEYVC